LKHGSVLIYDEPAQTWHHREFMSEGNIILHKTAAGYRFLRLISPLCVAAIDFIDKDARKLCQYMINIKSHGNGEVYKILKQKFGGDPRFKLVIDNFRITRPHPELRKHYEAKKTVVQKALYKQYEGKLMSKEAEQRTNKQLIEEIKNKPEIFLKTSTKGVTRWHVPTIMGVLDIGRDKADRLRAKIESDEAN